MVADPVPPLVQAWDQEVEEVMAVQEVQVLKMHGKFCNNKGPSTDLNVFKQDTKQTIK